MAPNGEALVSSYSKRDNNAAQKPNRLSMEGLQRTISDISFELSKETAMTADSGSSSLPSITEVEDGKCDCCGMSEECTPQYIKRIREEFLGKFVCGLCSEAIQREMEKNGGKREEALNEHVNACVKFNRFCRVKPILYQAEAMREILKKSSSINRAKSISPRDRTAGNSSKPKKGGIARTTSCIPALTRAISDPKMVN